MPPFLPVSAELVASSFSCSARAFPCWESSEAGNWNLFFLRTEGTFCDCFCYSPHLLASNWHLSYFQKHFCLLPACLEPASFYPVLPNEILHFWFYPSCRSAMQIKLVPYLTNFPLFPAELVSIHRQIPCWIWVWLHTPICACSDLCLLPSS